jgi:hypothetical protein
MQKQGPEVNKYTDLMNGLSLSVYLNKEKKKT